MKRLFSFLVILCFLQQLQGQCPVGPAQLLNAYYEYKWTKFRDLLQIPRHSLPGTCVDTAMLYYNPVDSNLYGWTGTQYRCLSCGLGSTTQPGLPVTSVQFNSGPGVFRGSSHMTFDSSKFIFTVDTANHKQLYVTRSDNFQYPVQFSYSYGGYGGLLMKNNSSSASASTRITLQSRGGHELQLNQFDESFATDAAVIAGTGKGGVILRADSSMLFFEMGPPGTGNAELASFWYPSGNMQIGTRQDHPYNAYDHHVQLYVQSNQSSTNQPLGSILTNKAVRVADDGHGYAFIGSWNYLADTTYVEGAGIALQVYTKNNSTLEVARLDTSGRWTVGGEICAGCLYFGQPVLDPSAELQANSTTKGFLGPRMTAAQRNAIATPANGLQVFNTDAHKPEWYDNVTGAWTRNMATHNLFTPIAGGTVFTIASSYNIINPAGGLASLTIAFPSSPHDNDWIELKLTQTVTTVTWSNGTVVNAPTSNVSGYLKLVYDGTTSSWY